MARQPTTGVSFLPIPTMNRPKNPSSAMIESKKHPYWRYNRLWPLTIAISLLFLAFEPTPTLADDSDAAITSSSVILITGAAGFIGSELAMALHRTYQPKLIIGMDALDSGLGAVVPRAFGPDLGLLEFKRQRVFHVMQVLGDRGVFYRVDFRPSVPEFWEAGEVPVLHHVMTLHKDITHVIHLADAHLVHGNRQQQPVIPRLAGQAKAGMMESILEELRVCRDTWGRTPHFVYASSDHVYNSRTGVELSNPPPFREDLALSVPSSMAGASKLMDEILAQTYFDMDGLVSIGLRFFSVYGPWGVPGSAVFAMAERAILGGSPLSDTDAIDDVADYVYIDDAVDAIMAAMQVAADQPMVLNVGTGRGTSLREVGQIMKDLLKDHSKGDGLAEQPERISIASTTLAEQVLGFKALVPLETGLEQLLAWHYDRAFPYGGTPDPRLVGIADKGIVACSKYDVECLRGAPIFPCASECSHATKCISTLYDDVLMYTRQLTEHCETVMYTVDLREGVDTIASAMVEVSSTSKSHVDNVSGSRCNLAFVADQSPLVRRLITGQGGRTQLVHGHWTLVPVSVSQYAVDHLESLQLLPKLSPGQFFGKQTTRAIYCDPNVIFDNVDLLLSAFGKTPGRVEGEEATAMLIGRNDAPSTRTPMAAASHELLRRNIQETAYRLIRIAAIDQMNGQSFAEHVDSSFMVHALRNDDSRLFRCDIYGELVQWDVTSDTSAIEFIMGVHDMWSGVIAKKRGEQPWWIGENVEEKPRNEEEEETVASVEESVEEVPEGEDSLHQAEMGAAAKIEEEPGMGEVQDDANGQDSPEVDAAGEEDPQPVQGDEAIADSEDKEQVEVPVDAKGSVGDKAVDEQVTDGQEVVTIAEEESQGQADAQRRRLEADTDEDDESEDGELVLTGWESEHNGFGMPEAIQDAVRAVFGDAAGPLAADDDEEEGNGEEDAGSADTTTQARAPPRQRSKDDAEPVWMGVLSSAKPVYYARIVSSREVGAIHLDKFGRVAEQ